MLNKLFVTFVVLPLGILLVVFAIANRHSVTLSLDPFGAAAPALSATMPLFVLILLMLLIGVLTGSLSTWLGQARWRKATRRLTEETRRLRNERNALRTQIAARDAAARQAAVHDPVAGDSARREFTALPAPETTA